MTRLPKINANCRLDQLDVYINIITLNKSKSYLTVIYNTNIQTHLYDAQRG